MHASWTSQNFQLNNFIVFKRIVKFQQQKKIEIVATKEKLAITKEIYAYNQTHHIQISKKLKP